MTHTYTAVLLVTIAAKPPMRLLRCWFRMVVAVRGGRREWCAVIAIVTMLTDCTMRGTISLMYYSYRETLTYTQICKRTAASVASSSQFVGVAQACCAGLLLWCWLGS